jgi:NTE family protein
MSDPVSDGNHKETRIGLALSGGGARAIAFHLGCLRALHEVGLLDRVSVLSTVSGGSIIGAAYSLHDGTFQDFECKMRALLKNGLTKTMFRSIFGPIGLKMLSAFAIYSTVSSVIFCITHLAKLVSWILPSRVRSNIKWREIHSPIARFASRTSLLEAALNRLVYAGALIGNFRSDKPITIVNATELRTGSAFRFSARESGSWRWGRLTKNDIQVAHAVAASAAYPVFLPAFDEIFEFEKKGVISRNRVLLSDGGVYENLGLGPLWPDRNPEVSLNVTNVNVIVCCSAGYGLRQDPPSQFLFARMNSAFSTTFDRAQNASISRLHELKATGRLRNFLFPYLGQQDNRLPTTPEGLVPREEVHAYPTDFFAMSDYWVERLSLRGYQLTTCLARAYLGEFLGPN